MQRDALAAGSWDETETDLLEHKVGGVNRDGSGRAVLLGLLDASEVDAHASAVHGLDLRGASG